MVGARVVVGARIQWGGGAVMCSLMRASASSAQTWKELPPPPFTRQTIEFPNSLTPLPSPPPPTFIQVLDAARKVLQVESIGLRQEQVWLGNVRAGKYASPHL